MANWKSTIREPDGYDADHTTDWHFNLGVDGLEELTPTFIQDKWDDLKNKVFIGTTPNEYDYTDGNTTIDTDVIDTNDESGNLVSVQELIVYTTAKSVTFLVHIGLWFKKILRGA